MIPVSFELVFSKFQTAIDRSNSFLNFRILTIIFYRLCTIHSLKAVTTPNFTNMKKMTLLFGVAIFLYACKKDPVGTPLIPSVKMIYKNLSDSAVVFGRSASFDLDGNGEKDIFFNTMLVGDPISQQDKKQWLVISSFNTNLPVNINENIPVLNLNDSIPVADFSGYNWYNASSILLSQKIISTMSPPYWEGTWKDALHRFIPLQLKRNNSLFNGWVEVSFDKVQEKVTLHKAAVSEEPNKMVIAGK
jgi:hypothetical protein